MSIEYLPDVKAGQKIDLSRFKEKKNFEGEKMFEFFHQQLAEKAEAYNRYYNQEWLADDASIKLFEHPDREEDERLIGMQEGQWAKERGVSLGQWQHDKERNPAALAEMALTIFLQRCLPERYMIVRSSFYDDYNNGVDQLIIDRESGTVVCGIDEVIERAGCSTPGNKEGKIRRKMQKGGARVKYGARVVEGELVLGRLGRVPAFYLSLGKNDLTELQTAFANGNPGAYEEKLLQSVLASLRSQAKSYDDLELSEELRSELGLFINSLDSWQK